MHYIINDKHYKLYEILLFKIILLLIIIAILCSAAAALSLSFE